MTLKDFKYALVSTARCLEKFCKGEDDYYMGYLNATEDILFNINEIIKEGEENEGLSLHNGSTCERGL